MTNTHLFFLYSLGLLGGLLLYHLIAGGIWLSKPYHGYDEFYRQRKRIDFHQNWLLRIFFSIVILRLIMFFTLEIQHIKI